MMKYVAWPLVVQTQVQQNDGFGKTTTKDALRRCSMVDNRAELLSTRVLCCVELSYLLSHKRSLEAIDGIIVAVSLVSSFRMPHDDNDSLGCLRLLRPVEMKSIVSFAS